MDNLLQGTTPYLVIDFTDTGLDVSDFSAAELTLKTNINKRTYDLSKMSLDSEENTLTYHFSEADTLALSATAPAYWQIYVKVGAEIFGTESEQLKILKKEKGAAMA